MTTGRPIDLVRRPCPCCQLWVPVTDVVERALNCRYDDPASNRLLSCGACCDEANAHYDDLMADVEADIRQGIAMGNLCDGNVRDRYDTPDIEEPRHAREEF